ncbi:MAG: hypothetical protein AB8B55_16125 [Mariniblastus sp.]
MARMNAKICLFFLLNLIQIGYLSAAVRTAPGEPLGIRLEKLTSPRCYLFEHIEIEYNARHEKSSAAKTTKTSTAARCPIAADASSCPAENLDCNETDSELASVRFSRIFGLVQLNHNEASRVMEGAFQNLIVVRGEVVGQIQKIGNDGLENLQLVSLSVKETIESRLNDVLIFTAWDENSNSKKTPAINVSHRKIVVPSSDVETDSGVEPSADTIEEMPIELKGHDQHPYWQYYEDCDRWGVEFAKILKEAKLLKRNVPRIRNTPIANDAMHVVFLKEKRRDSINEISNFYRHDLLRTVPGQNFDNITKKSQPKLSVMNLIGAQSVMAWASVSPRIAEITSNKFSDSFDSLEFFIIENHGIDFQMAWVEQLHPATHVLKFGIAPLSNQISKWNENKLSIFEIRFISELTISISKAIEKSESERKIRRERYRHSLANRIEWASKKLDALASAIRSNDQAGNDVGSLAKQVDTTQTK